MRPKFAGRLSVCLCRLRGSVGLVLGFVGRSCAYHYKRTKQTVNNPPQIIEQRQPQSPKYTPLLLSVCLLLLALSVGLCFVCCSVSLSLCVCLFVVCFVLSLWLCLLASLLLSVGLSLSVLCSHTGTKKRGCFAPSLWLCLSQSFEPAKHPRSLAYFALFGMLLIYPASLKLLNLVLHTYAETVQTN